MRKYNLLFALLLLCQFLYSQVDTLHFLPPLFCTTAGGNDRGKQTLFFSTFEESNVSVKIYSGDNLLHSLIINKNNPGIWSEGNASIGSSHIETNIHGLVTWNQTGKPIQGEGLRIEADKPIYVSERHQSRAQGTLITSKGTVGLGFHFFSGHSWSVIDNRQSNKERGSAFISVMATQDNTEITFENPHGLALRDYGTTQGDTKITTVLNANETYTIAIRHDKWRVNGSINNAYYQDRNHMNGTEIKSDKPIAVTCGSWCAITGDNRRDVGVDQIVPVNNVGTEYIVLQGQGREENENPSRPDHETGKNAEKVIVIATTDNTSVKVNGAAPVTLNKGAYTVLDHRKYQDNAMYLESDKPVYVYQSLVGHPDHKDNAGMVFLPPLKCTADRSALISHGNTLDIDHTMDRSLMISTRKGAEVKVNGIKLNNAKSISGNQYWELYDVNNSFLSSLSSQNYEVVSTGALNVALVLQSGVRGAAGFFSGFGDKPRIDGLPTIEGGNFCAGDIEIRITNGGFIRYKWYRNGVEIPGDTDQFNVAMSGRYTVKGETYCDGGTIWTSESNAIDVESCLQINDISIHESDDALFTVKLSHAMPVAVSFSLELRHISTDDTDFKTTHIGNWTIPAGETLRDFNWELLKDNKCENAEEFQVVITNASVTIYKGVGEGYIEREIAISEAIFHVRNALSD
jgi:hypothetical protein